MTSRKKTMASKTMEGSPLWQRIFRTRAEDSLPHTITHQRIYIVPSKRGCAFLIALLLMLIASVNYSLSLGYALCFLLTGLFAATLLHTYSNLAGLGVLAIETHNEHAGKPVAFTITLDNQKTQPRHGIRVLTQSRYTASARIAAEDQAVAEIKIDTEKRGLLKLGRLTLQSDWPLGLWTSWSYLHVPVQALVYPAAELDAPALPSHVVDGEGTEKLASHQGDVSGLRDYVEGDTIGSIAWKSVARGLGLHVRTFESIAGPASTSLDLQKTGLSDQEDQLSRLCAWVLRADSSQTDYALDLPHQQLGASHGREHRLRALQALALFGQHSAYSSADEKTL